MPKNIAEWGLDFNRLASTYIIEGSVLSQITDAADKMAAAILCEDKVNKPCGKCRVCLLTGSSNNPDLKYITEPQDKKSIGVDEIRQMIGDVYIKPFLAGHKVYVILSADKLTKEAQNAMLKVLEEPPYYAVFILCTTAPDTILETIHSRGVHLRLKAADYNKTSKFIADTYPQFAQLSDFIAKYCGGIKQRAVELCETDIFNLRREFIDLLLKVTNRNEVDMFSVFNFFEREDAKSNTEALLEFAQLFFRDALSYCITKDSNILINTDLLEDIKKLSDALTQNQLSAALSAVSEAIDMLVRHVSGKALILCMLIKIWDA